MNIIVCAPSFSVTSISVICTSNSQILGHTHIYFHLFVFNWFCWIKMHFLSKLVNNAICTRHEFNRCLIVNIRLGHTKLLRVLLVTFHLQLFFVQTV